MFLKLATVNLIKHRKRTLLILFAIMMSVLVMEVIAGMFHGMRVNFFENLAQESGHIQITAEGREDSLNPYSLEYTISGYKEIIAEIQQLGGVQAAEEILVFGGLLQFDERNITLSGTGVRQDTSFYSHVKEGLQKGRFPPRRGEIVVSRRNAELLEVTLQDEMLLVVEDSSGSPFYLPYQVGGIFETTAREFDENTIFIQHADAQELVYLQDETTEIRIRLESPQQAESIAAAIANRLDNNELNIRTFRDIHSGVMSMIDMLDFFIIFMNLFVVIVAASVITNAILMNVFERIREFGTMRAIGMKKRGVFRIILIEGGAQGLLGSVLGLLVGIPVVLYFSRQGFEMGEAAEAFGMGMSEFRFAFSIRNSMLNAVGGVLIAMGGSLYAAFVGTRLSIMEALRHD